MAAPFRKIVIQFETTGTGKVKKDADGVALLMKGLAAQIGIATTAADLAVQAITGLGRAFISAGEFIAKNSNEFERQVRALALFNSSVASTAAQVQRLRTLALQPGLDFQNVLKGANYLQAAGFSAKQAEGAIKTFGNALALAGKGSEDLQGVFLALGQIKAKGIISAEEINQIAERVPQVRTALVDAFGTGNTKSIQEMGITASVFLDKITNSLKKLKTAPMTIQTFITQTVDRFKYAAIILGKGFQDIFYQPDTLKLANTFFDNLKQLALGVSGVLSGFAQTDAFQKFKLQIKDSLVIFQSLIPGMTRSFAIGLSVVSVMVNELFKLGNALSNFFGQLFFEPTKLWEKELKGFIDWMYVNLARPFEGLATTLLRIPARIQMLSTDPRVRQQGENELKRLDFNQKLFDKQYRESIQGKRAVQQTPFTKAIIASGNFVTQFSMIDDLLPTRNKGLIAKMLEQYDEMMLKSGFLNVLPPNLFPGDAAGRPDEKQKADDDKKKTIKALELIENNTRKANELTLRNLTYGGGQLAAQGLSNVEMSGFKTVSSPGINASNDIVRGIEKIVRGYSNSNNLNFSFRRS